MSGSGPSPYHRRSSSLSVSMNLSPLSFLHITRHSCAVSSMIVGIYRGGAHVFSLPCKMHCSSRGNRGLNGQCNVSKVV
ncbi:hypothetical protein FOMG_18843 [Fusarium oxysporum f. sp. melonis 26406]|uniref:Uncharacterized protein n=1 Tax=Fusarium oxysporum f. sp. melonis 26406 TaxID=1089452 RepID=W9ZTL2_FUSOX|nr:hypothetical protein FOMG_18843 [Fusarium oxysporum f. sp. melonis 26406]